MNNIENIDQYSSSNNPQPFYEQIRFWKVLTGILTIVALILLVRPTSQPLSKQTRPMQTEIVISTPTPSPSPSNEPSIIPPEYPTLEDIQKYHINSYPAPSVGLSKGRVSIIESNLFVENPHFVLSLQTYPIGREAAKIYEIPLSDMDSVSDPLIAYGEKFGCVTIQSSGYVGYYIFNLATGEQIAEGKQYSGCIEWIDDNEVIIAENEYGSRTYVYSVYNAETKQKTQLSTFSI